MLEKDFEQFFDLLTKRLRRILIEKNADYSSGVDKLANFKQAARRRGITAEEALDGMKLKHECSLETGVKELSMGKVRPWDWWLEKGGDDINYAILRLALVYESHFTGENIG